MGYSFFLHEEKTAMQTTNKMICEKYFFIFLFTEKFIRNNYFQSHVPLKFLPRIKNIVFNIHQSEICKRGNITAAENFSRVTESQCRIPFINSFNKSAFRNFIHSREDGI